MEDKDIGKNGNENKGSGELRECAVNLCVTVFTHPLGVSGTCPIVAQLQLAM